MPAALRIRALIPVAALIPATALIAVAALIAAAAGPALADDPAPADPPPEGVEQLLPRGGIPAIFHPVFVSAREAGLPDDAWILGVALGGEARAYSLNLLNNHEVVNDRIGEHPFAAVW